MRNPQIGFWPERTRKEQKNRLMQSDGLYQLRAVSFEQSAEPDAGKLNQ